MAQMLCSGVADKQKTCVAVWVPAPTTGLAVPDVRMVFVARSRFLSRARTPVGLADWVEVH